MHPLVTKMAPFLHMWEGFTARQVAILASLVDATEEARTIRGLSNSLDLSKPAIVRACDRLTELSLVRRRPDPHDKRSVFVEITAAGKKLLAKAV